MILKHLSRYTKYENKPQWIRAVGAIPGQDFSSTPKDRYCYSGSDEHREKWYLLQRQYDFLEFCMWRKSKGKSEISSWFWRLKIQECKFAFHQSISWIHCDLALLFFNHHPFFCSPNDLFPFSSHQYLTFKRTGKRFPKIMHLQQNSINNFKIN